MIASPWDILLTLAFVWTGAVCTVFLIRSRRAAAKLGRSALSDGEVVDLNHGLMSIAMLAMTWLAASDVFMWAQVAVFVLLSIALVTAIPRASSAPGRIDLACHITLNIAMIWMLLAMPWLMTGMVTEGDDAGAHTGHGAAPTATAPTETPPWVDAVNLGFVGLSVLVALWFLVRTIQCNGHRLHHSCHGVMAAGMAAMLFLMAA